MESPVLSRRERERLTRRTAMLDAARAVFAEKGYEGATLDEIAERAEFGKGTLYNYFEGGKEGILQALINDLFDSVEEIVTAHVKTGENRPVRAIFHALLTELVGFFEANRDTFLLVIKEVQRMMLAPCGAVEREVWERDARVIRLIERPIARAIEAGELRAFPPEAIVRTVFGNMQGILMHRFCAPAADETSPISSAEGAADFVTTVLFDGLSPRD